MMSHYGGISRQCSDLFAYVLFPILSALTPAAFSRSVLSRISSSDSLLREDAARALAGARKHLEISDEDAWLKRWKQVELLDARDLYMMLAGRSGAVLAEIDVPANFELARDRVMVGMHWGPAISILKLLANAGMRPTFPYRPPEKELRRSRPFYYLYSRLSSLYLALTLKDRAVTTGGAGKVLQQLLQLPGSICVLMDAPAEKGRPAASRILLGRPATFNVGFPARFIEQEKEYVHFAVSLADDGTARKKLELVGSFRAATTDEYLDRFVPFLESHLSADSAQFRIWRAEHQVWKDPAETTGHQ
jgi:hypothetical protein